MDDNIRLFLEVFSVGFGFGLFVGFFCSVFRTVIKFFFNLFRKG